MARTSTSTKKRAGLTAQQRLFAHELAANGGNQTEAAISAGYSARSARNQGARLMANEDIRALVADLNAKRLAKVDAKADAVLAELRHVGMARLSRVIRIHPDQTPSVSVLPLEEWGEDELAALTKVDVEKIFENLGRDGRVHVGDIVKLEMKGKLAALETLAKHHGLLKEVVEHRGDFLLVNPYALPPGGGGPSHATGPGKPAASEGGA